MASISDASKEAHPLAKKALNASDAVIGLAILLAIVAGISSVLKRTWSLVTDGGWQSQPFDQLLGLVGELGSWQRVFQIDSLWWLFLLIPISLYQALQGIHWLLDPRERAEARARHAGVRDEETRAKLAQEERRAARRAARKEAAGARGPSALRKGLRVMWNGPFATPPVPSPVSVGWVLLKALETLWRFIVILLGALLLTLLAASVWSLLNPPLYEQLEVTAAVNNSDCREGNMPLRLEITNTSGRTVSEWSLAISVFETGRSTNLATEDYRSNPRTIDYVIRPYETIVLCSTLPELSRTPEGSVSYHPDIRWASEAVD